MMKKTLLLLALTVSVLGAAEGSFAGEKGSAATTDTVMVTEDPATGTGETKGKELNGFISGQFLPGKITDVVKGEGSSARPAPSAAWDGFVTGTAGSARENQDRAIVPVHYSKGKKAWGGYLAGSLGNWQREI